MLACCQLDESKADTRSWYDDEVAVEVMKSSTVPMQSLVEEKEQVI